MVRYKKRYLVASIEAEPVQRAGLGAKDIFAALKESIATHYGDMAAGATASSLQVRSYDAAWGITILRVARDFHQMVRASLTLVSGTKGALFSVNVEGVAGCERTLEAPVKAAYKRAFRRAGVDPEDKKAFLKRRTENLGFRIREGLDIP